VGALNGSGKTTLLESIQLALYGRSAKQLLRDATGYDDYLRSLINRHVSSKEGAAVTLEFSHRAEGRQINYAVRRTWSATGSRVREDLEVSRDGLPDPAASERWVEFINGLLPVQIADLFLFDGERIEALAKPDTAADVLRTGVHALLGLDLVDNLARSLGQLERRMQRSAVASETEADIAKAEALITEMAERRQQLVADEASAQNEVDEAEKGLWRLQERLRSEGGELAETRDLVEKNVEDFRLALESIEAELRELASESIPIRLIEPLASEAALLCGASSEGALDRAIRERVELRRAELGDSLRSLGVAKAKVNAVLGAIADRIAPQGEDAPDAIWQELLAWVPGSDAVLESIASSTVIAEALARWQSAAEQLGLAEAKLAAVPASDTVAHLVEAVAVGVAKLAAATARRDSLTVDREAVDRSLTRERDRMDELFSQRREADRIAVHSARARDVLASFRAAVAAKKLHALESRIADNFRRLLRKAELVDSISIDPVTFQLTVIGSEGVPIPPERLSAGERQLMAVAVLWSLAQASGRELPIVIDTPLGRLDGSHRDLLVQNYFPKASHQVILLSTDEEVRDRYYEALVPFISRQYLISHRERDRTSSFSEGYFSVGAAA
jgi:DNA sulfur modification protein DndD